MHKEMSEHEMYAIIQQEWARFKAEMEQQSMEYGLLDAGIIEDIEDDLGHSRCSGGFGQNINAGADGQDMDCQMREYIEWEEYENQILEDDILDEEMRQLCIDMDTDPDMDLLYSSENTNSRHQNTTSMQ
ncbi:hypothetical protein EDC05_006131 [Coemansia umbellata]|nr:hypothetical protein EDC05_006131 [Coemansia umbellata]